MICHQIEEIAINSHFYAYIFPTKYFFFYKICIRIYMFNGPSVHSGESRNIVNLLNIVEIMPVFTINSKNGLIW